jgi:hypothetical protein
VEGVVDVKKARMTMVHKQGKHKDDNKNTHKKNSPKALSSERMNNCWCPPSTPHNNLLLYACNLHMEEG